MIKEETIRKLVDYILLNACSVNSSGLYNGKAGMALALFEIARLLQDDVIEEQAFDLIQEALLSTNNDIGFENGLSGIGYVLLYLIENNFIDADFDELFSDKQTRIEKGLHSMKEKHAKESYIAYIQVAYYLYQLNKIKESRNTDKLIRQVLKETDKVLISRLSAVENNTSKQPKNEIIYSLELYFKVSHYCDSSYVSEELVKIYKTLYSNSKFISSYGLAFYLGKIQQKVNLENVESTCKMNMERAIQTTSPEYLSLLQKIDLAYMLQENSVEYGRKLEIIENSFLSIDDTVHFEKKILKSIVHGAFVAGYQSGLSRLLLYYAYKHQSFRDRKRFAFL